MNDLKILTTVSFGKTEVTAPWTFLPGKGDSYVVLAVDQNKNEFVIKVNNTQIKDYPGQEIASKICLGTLDSSKGFLMKH